MILREYFPCEVEAQQHSSLDIKHIKYIYERIGDDYSREIFTNRLMYSLTGDYEYIGKILAHTETGINLENMLAALKSVYIYGAGRRGILLLKMFPGIKWKGFIDKKGEGLCMDYPIYSPAHFECDHETSIIISLANGGREVQKYLIESRGVSPEQVILLDEYIEKISNDIYLDSKYVKNIDMADKIFMDLGCYDGKDSIRAIHYFKDDAICVFALEPDDYNYQRCADVFSQYGGRVQLLKKGVGNKKTIERFQEGEGTGSRFSKKGDLLVEIDTIDDIAGSKNVGFIKMDIEGMEEAAITGGKNTIKRCSPVLAISIYHKRSDIWRIPLKILEINPSYHFYFEHYTFGWSDTVLYAVAE